jgi:hypothetical protein
MSTPFRLSFDELNGILESTATRLSPGSPVGFLRYHDEKNPSPIGDAQKRAVRLPQFTGDALFRQSLDVVANPEGRLRISMLAPPMRAHVLNLFILGDRVISAFFDNEGFEMSPPSQIDEFADILASQLVTQRPNLPRQSYWNAHIRVASILWPGTHTKPTKGMSIELTLRELARIGIERNDGLTVIRSLVSAHCVKEENDELVLDGSFALWMNLFWSQHSLRLEYKRLQGGTLEALGRQEKRMILVGPPGERCYCDAQPAGEILAEAGLLGDPAFSGLERNTVVSFGYYGTKAEALTSLKRFLLLRHSVVVRKCTKCGKPHTKGKFCTQCGGPVTQ